MTNMELTTNTKLENIVRFLTEVASLRLYESAVASMNLPENTKELHEESMQMRVTSLQMKYGNLVDGPEKDYLTSIVASYAAKNNKKELLQKLDTPIEDLDISVRAIKSIYGYFKRCENGKRTDKTVEYIGELVNNNESDFLKAPNFGKMCLHELKKSLAERGLSLGMNINYVLPENR